ncbi:MAG: cation transporting ATPase C-terminal domain-containing protein, partial [Candidatus Micrarchaeia archaeon]
EIIHRTTVFASATSEYKKLVIDELKNAGEVVLFVDSGTADIPALKSANVSMSLESATEISKYNADAILLNDNFYWAPKSIEESKTLEYVVIRSFYSLLISDVAIIFLILLSAVLESKTMNMLQILMVNFVADMLIGVGLATDRPKRSGLKNGLKFPSKGILAFSVFMSVLMAVAVYAVADFFPGEYFTSIVTTGIVLCVIVNTLSFSSDEFVFKSPPTWRIALAITISVVFLLIIMYTPMGPVFGMLPLMPQHWGLLLGIAATVLVLMEAREAIGIKR